MNFMQRVIYAGFAAAALASASMPVFSSSEPVAFADEVAATARATESNRR